MKFQINDLLRRKPEHQQGAWSHGNDPVTVTANDIGFNGNLLYVNGGYITWDEKFFDLLYRPSCKVQTVISPAIKPIPVPVVAEKQSDGKTPFDILFSLPGLSEIADVFGIGAKKYPDKFGDYNWRAAKKDMFTIRAYKKKLIGACLRHVFQYINGQTHDKETGKHHLAHAITNLLMVHDLEQ